MTGCRPPLPSTLLCSLPIDSCARFGARETTLSLAFSSCRRPIVWHFAVLTNKQVQHKLAASLLNMAATRFKVWKEHRIILLLLSYSAGFTSKDQKSGKSFYYRLLCLFAYMCCSVFCLSLYWFRYLHWPIIFAASTEAIFICGQARNRPVSGEMGGNCIAAAWLFSRCSLVQGGDE